MITRKRAFFATSTQILESVYVLYIHLLLFSDILSGPDMPEHNISFISLKTRIIELLLKALMIDADSTNTQMLLGKF